MRSGGERAMLGWGHPVRLAQTLAKAVVILAVIAATLGGAAALGSTLFEAPPRDAAEFAARVEAGSIHAPPAEKRTQAERTYILAVGALCAERNEQVRDLEQRVPAYDEVGRTRGRRRIQADHAEAFAALAPPKRFRPIAARVAALDQGILDLADGALKARRRGDREAFEAKREAAELLDARYDQAVLGLDAPVCAAS
jgi:hypothetical protein